MQLRSFKVLTVAFLSLLLSRVAMAQSVDQLLLQADRVRTSDARQFSRLLGQLDQQASSATQPQRMTLDLLHAYQTLLSGNYPAAIAQLRAIIASKPDPDLRYRAEMALANVYAASNQLSDGLSILQDALLRANSVRDQGTQEQGLLVAAILYNQVGQYQLGLRYAQEVLGRNASPRSRCMAGGLRIEALEYLGHPPPDDEIDASINLCESIHEGIPSGFVRTYLARKWLGENKIAAAIALLDRAVDEADATKYPRLIGEVHSLRSELFLKNGDLDAARKEALLAIAQKAGIDRTPPLVAAYRTLYSIEEQHHDVPAALAYYKLFAQAQQGYLNEVRTRELAYQIVRAQNEQKSQQIELLNRRNNVLQLQQQVDQQSAQNSRLYMLLFALLAATISYWAYKTKRMQMSIRHMAETDALTGICNRHHYTSQAEKTLSRCKALGEPVSLLMFDLDYFKSINDNYGHVTGDWVLKRVAVVCAELCRGIDHIGRIGGEEFAILLHGCDLKAATRVAEDCRVRLSRIDPLPSGYVFPISASFGVSSSATSGYDLDKLLSHADQMLYRAKREGRNRVRAFVTETSAELTGIHFGKDSRQVVTPEDRPRQDSRRA